MSAQSFLPSSAPDLKTGSGRMPPGEGYKMLKVENVRKSFGSATVLDGVNLTINPGEVVSILGSSGSGKSTLIRCINGLEKLNGGAITVDNFDVSKPNELAEARKRSATVFQLFNLYPHMTVLGNITLAPVEVLKKPRA